MKITEEIRNLLLTGCAIEDKEIIRGLGIDRRESTLLTNFLRTFYIYEIKYGWEYKCPGSKRRLEAVLNGQGESSSDVLHPETRFYLQHLHDLLAELFTDYPSSAEIVDWLTMYEETLSDVLGVASTVAALENEDEDDADDMPDENGDADNPDMGHFQCTCPRCGFFNEVIANTELIEQIALPCEECNANIILIPVHVSDDPEANTK